jgi:hypothetical protein
VEGRSRRTNASRAENNGASRAEIIVWHEGKFYVWEPDEIIEALGSEEGELFCRLYDITEEGNFEGHNIPNLIEPDLATFAQQKNLALDRLKTVIENSLQKLFQHREQCINPGKDNKILTSWNGLMIIALAKGYMVLEKKEYLDAVVKAADFIQSKMIRDDGRLLARYRDGEAAFPAYLDDYANLVWGFTELYEATFNKDYLRKAIDLNHRMVGLFWDERDGGFYFYGNDGAMPSGNSVAIMNLLKLSRLTGDE